MPKLIVDITVYTFDIDYNQHVSNIAFVRWMELCRNRLFDALGLSQELLAAQNCLPVVAETQIIWLFRLLKRLQRPIPRQRFKPIDQSALN